MSVCVRVRVRCDAQPSELFLINSLQSSFCTDSTKNYISVNCYQNVNLAQLSTNI